MNHLTELWDNKFANDYLNGIVLPKNDLKELRKESLTEKNNVYMGKMDYVKEYVLKNNYVKIAMYTLGGIILLFILGKTAKVLSTTILELKEFQKALNS